MNTGFLTEATRQLAGNEWKKAVTREKTRNSVLEFEFPVGFPGGRVTKVAECVEPSGRGLGHG